MASSNQAGYLPGLGQSDSQNTSAAKTSSIPRPSTSSSSKNSPAKAPNTATATAAAPSSSRLREQVPGAELSSNEADVTGQKKKPRHRAGKKRRKRRESFAAPPESVDGMDSRQRPSLMNVPEHASQDARDSFYRLGRGQRGSATSLESEALLDHRYVHTLFYSNWELGRHELQVFRNVQLDRLYPVTHMRACNCKVQAFFDGSIENMVHCRLGGRVLRKACFLRNIGPVYPNLVKVIITPTVRAM
jgi:hypothetical protein